MFSPVLSKLNYIGLIVVRILEGLGGGLTFPAMNVLIAAWAPDQERSTISSLIYGGKNTALLPQFCSKSLNDYIISLESS